MSTTDSVLLIILACLLSLFFVLCIALAIGLIQLVSAVKRVAEKAEDVVDSVESAAEVFKDTQGRLAFFKLVRNLMKLAKKRGK